MENFLRRWRHYVSPVFLMLLVASFILWYIAKLGYTYTTEQELRVNVDGEVFHVSCVVEGLGTNLFGYKVYAKKTLRIPLSELQYELLGSGDGTERIAIDPHSLQHAISVRISDIKVVSIGNIPEIELPEETPRNADRS